MTSSQKSKKQIWAKANSSSDIKMETAMRGKWRRARKADGGNTSTSLAKNTQVASSMMKSMDMVGITFCQEQSMKVIGAVE